MEANPNQINIKNTANMRSDAVSPTVKFLGSKKAFSTLKIYLFKKKTGHLRFLEGGDVDMSLRLYVNTYMKRSGGGSQAILRNLG